MDGSSINIPTTDENLSVYGNASVKDVKTQAQLGLSCLYDTVNKMIIDTNINRWKFNERDQSLIHIDIMREVIGDNSSIVIFDRRYPSGELLVELLDRQQKFLMRLSSTTFKKEQLQMKTDDGMVEIFLMPVESIPIKVQKQKNC